ncbi:hypothetical protein NDU88_010924 [Pleurodeles waltl]|uniref:Uncharacterized protein n=1 Tax=Pleurodeles waltl TaxID=8319 RepID=A0AAV7PZT7_PLEWA|nr:hypothetical protein NDU88_010924 [Pleurodeles waltl]
MQAGVESTPTPALEVLTPETPNCGRRVHADEPSPYLPGAGSEAVLWPTPGTAKWRSEKIPHSFFDAVSKWNSMIQP